MPRVWVVVFAVCVVWGGLGLLVMLQYGSLSDPTKLAISAAFNFGPLAIATVIWAATRRGSD
jgi:hypothetical protein